MSKSLKVKELTAQDIGLEVTAERDLSRTGVEVYAFPHFASDSRTKIGSTTGAAADTKFVIDLEISLLEPGTYDLEVVADDKIVYPYSPNENLNLTIVNAKYND